MTEKKTWACGNIRAAHGHYDYELNVAPEDRTTACPKCGHVDQLYIRSVRIRDAFSATGKRLILGSSPSGLELRIMAHLAMQTTHDDDAHEARLDTP